MIATSELATRASESPILIVGGGVAGSSCAIRLREHGIAVELMERQFFPRNKVCGCCLGGAGLAALDQLGLLERTRELGISTKAWCASLGRRRLNLSIPDSLAISRESLDPMLIERASEMGAEVSMGREVRVIENGRQSVQVRIKGDGRTKPAHYRSVVIASGLISTGLQQELPWTETPHGPFGVSFMASSNDVEEGVIYMACHDDGYVGLVKLLGGRVDVAAALRSGSEATAGGDPVSRVMQILSNSHLPNIELSDHSAPMTTPPLRRTRLAGKGRLVMIGDAAGYVEPFTGEGMTWAMQSGIAAADRIAIGRGNLESIGDVWSQASNRMLRNRKRTCRWITCAIRSPLARQIAAQTLAYFPVVAQPLLRSLNKA